MIEQNTSIYKSDKFYLYASPIILIIGVILRLVYLEYPYGINYDEAIAGYDAWCIAHYGVDQHLASYPVYLKSWGSGQSALYAYLSAPLVKMFGLSLPVHRLPMATVSSLCLIIFYYTMKRMNLSKFFIFLTTLFFAFNPWHFTKSRWALDCNLAPDLVLIGTCFIILGYLAQKNSKKNTLFILGFISIALAAYGYAVAWFMLPIYCLFIFILFYKNNTISIKQCALYTGVAIVVAAPLIVFAYQIFTGGDSVVIAGITIPKLNESRHEAVSIIGMPFSELPQYLMNVLKDLVTGYDHLLTNSFPYTGQFYNPIGWIFILITFGYFIWRKKLNILDSLFLLWLVACIPILFFAAYNVNRWNMIWFPLIYFCVRGIDLCIAKKTIPKIIFGLAFTFLTTMFALNYLMVHDKAFLSGIEGFVERTSSKDIDEAHISGNVQYPAILFYDPISPYLFDKTKVELDKHASFTFLKQFGKYKMSVPYRVEPKERTAYVIPSWQVKDYIIDVSKFQMEENEEYTILWND